MAAGAAALAVTAGAILPGTAAASPAFDHTWTTVDGDVVYTVPLGTCQVFFELQGGGGGGGNGVLGGPGGDVAAWIPVSAGDTFFVRAGSAGGAYSAGGSVAGGMAGTAASGGAAPSGGTGGGGASIVRSGSTAAGTVLLVAGGGGGAGNESGATGGSAQQNTPQNGGGAAGAGGGLGGRVGAAGLGGTASGGNSPTSGGNGIALVGGQAAPRAGGGAGGYQAGGGGSSNESDGVTSGAGGGGGTNYVAASLETYNNMGTSNRGDGWVAARNKACTVPPTPVLDAAVSASVGRVTLTFHPGPDNGVPATGYEYSTDAGSTWNELSPSAGSGNALTATVTGLTAGQSYPFVVRANATANSPASNSISVVVSSTPPAPPAPGAPRSVSATADNAQLVVSWLAPNTGDDVDRYVVTLSPGGRTCTTTSLRCLFGAEAKVAYTATVVAMSESDIAGPGASSAASVPVVAPEVPDAAPATTLTLTTDKGLITSAAPDQEITVIGDGFLPYSTATVIIYSTPIVLGNVVTDGAGSFRRAVTVPASLEAGHHSLVASGVAPDGTNRFLRMNVTVAAARPAAAHGLAYTGAAVLGPLVVGLGALGLGVLVLILARRRRTV